MSFRIGRRIPFQGGQILLHAGVIDAQELVGASCHVNQVGLTLGAFLVHELVHRIILGLGLDETVHYQEQGLSQLG